MIGRKYHSLFDLKAQEGIEHYIVEWDLVDAESGSGVVHIAPGCGQEDFELGQELGVPSLSPLDTTGHFTEGYGDLTGKYAHDIADYIISDLEEKGLVFKTENFKHSYPHCWRCGTKCLFRLEDNWFIKIRDIRQQLKEEASKVKWIPEYALKRMQDWLDNMDDWMISRNRFYGLALPFYECKKCGELHIVGSKEELKELAIEPDLVDKLPSLHRPWIDEIKIHCPNCNEIVERVPEVGDCWLDAGVVGFSTLKYFEDKEYWQKWYPAEFVVEMIEQVRLWFYSMLVFGVIFEGKAPYETVMGFAEVRDEAGKRMSKTKANYIQLDDAANEVGTDIIRWNFATASIGANMRFSFNILEDSRRRFYLLLWNSYNYLVTYAKLHNWDYSKYNPKKVTNIMDKWIISKTFQLIKDIEIYMNEYNMVKSSREIEEYVTELSQWYIRRSRNRFRDGDLDAIGTLHFILVELSKILSPFIPFLSEEMYINIVKNLKIKNAKESVHLEEFTKVKEQDIDSKLLEDMKVIKEVCSNGLKIRESKGLSLRQPLKNAYVGISDKEMRDIIKEELNLKEVAYSEKPVREIGFDTVGQDNNFISLNTALTEELREEGMINDFLRKYRDIRKRKGLKMSDPISLRIYVGESDTRELLEKYIEANKEEVQIRDVEVVDILEQFDGEFEINGVVTRIEVIA